MSGEGRRNGRCYISRNVGYKLHATILGGASSKRKGGCMWTLVGQEPGLCGVGTLGSADQKLLTSARWPVIGVMLGRVG